ncbi:non-heme iron oxygenase ferredoxin subunit [Kineobactrum salinum]|uniref:Non-heme iron oxygenase ferredoxin subunit n=1 Tax=Kineobactrum salinum TaxID=2708301 RepID=A0A6C0TWG2_9GAMM|nr:non-heme iron oxygenase ferredoxin subunit [Kineobactrum salinum]QIB64116.1 non-heme iron oxygenase ferredoxin subunit [Kineobactrum salinum]
MTSETQVLHWHVIGELADFIEGQPVRRVIDGHEIAIFRVDDNLYALGDRCTHGDASLSEGWVEDGCVECPLHQAKFNLATGAVERRPAKVPVRAYPIRSEGDVVSVGI